jgi:tRNA A-37 threonylcarbamoyl transferase component Bud32
MIGAKIGSYEIVDKIGDGGMGVVYKARDTQLDRLVAVKALNPELSGNPVLMERFHSEARAQAKLNHPNLATVYAFLEQDGVAYMVMEFVDGETFHGMIVRRGPIPAAEAVPLFRQALAGIGYAHRMGIVHRDIKPSNIMLNRDGIVKVMDFGLAKVAGSHGLTRTGVRLGTAYYMSPEQVLVKPVDARSDIYSLGVTLYEMLAGQVPFDAASEFEILNDHVNTPPPPPSRPYAQIPPGIESAVLKALAKEPEQRFQSAEQFSAALERPAEFYLAKTVAADAPVPPDRRVTVAGAPAVAVPVVAARRVFWTRWWLVLAGACVVLACLLGAWLIWYFTRQPATVAHTQPPPVTAPAAASKPVEPDMPQSTERKAEKALPPASKPVANTVDIPDKTHIFAIPAAPVDSKASLGQVVVAHLTTGVTFNGHEVFHAGDTVQAQIVQGDPGSKEAKILELESITTRGHTYDVKGSASIPKKENVAKALIGRLAGSKDKGEQEAPIQFTLPEQIITPRPKG